MSIENYFRAVLIGLLLFGACSSIGCQKERTTFRSNGPESVQQARQHISIDLPDSGKNVQYAFYNEWQAVEEVLRFEAPVEDCRAIAEKIIAKHNAENPKRPTAGLRRLDTTWQDRTQPSLPSITAPLSAVWFDPQAIRVGLVGGNDGGHQPRIWIDTERGIFYYLYAD